MVLTKQKLMVDIQTMKTYCHKRSSNHKRIAREKGKKRTKEQPESNQEHGNSKTLQ